MKHSLNSSEWSLIAVFFLILLSCVFISKVNAARAASAIYEAPESQIQILVTVDGAVKKPGQYRVPEGTVMSALVRKARPSSWADLKALPLKDPIITPMHLHIPELKEIRVFVCGAVLESQELVLPVGSRIADLKSKIGFTDMTDKSFFRRKRLLRDGEKIEVPKKKLEENKRRSLCFKTDI